MLAKAEQLQNIDIGYYILWKRLGQRKHHNIPLPINFLSICVVLLEYPNLIINSNIKEWAPI